MRGTAGPRDYRDPSSPALSLAVTRLRATDPGARRGVLLTNPGGPGAPARWNTLAVDALAGHDLRRHFDLIGLDPRGVGASTPARCGLSGTLLSEATGDPTAVDFEADLAVAREIAASCARTGSDLWPVLSTANAVRDMDVRTRNALGSRAVMITTNDGGHGVFGRNRCATESAVAWLADGELPSSDTTC